MLDHALPALADRMQALASATRLRILLVLRDGALCVCQIAAILDVPASTISSHLADLRKAGIVGEHRKGRLVWHALRRHDDAIPWLRLVARQLTDDPQVAADHDRAVRIRLVPPEMLLTSTGCVPPNVPAAPNAGGTPGPRSKDTARVEQPVPT